MNQLEIQLFGGFAVQLNGKPITQFRSAKTRGLLAYLAAQPDRDHARTTLATLLWGNLPDAAAKTNLRIELSNLKKLLAAHPALEISRQVVHFNSRATVVDVTRLQKAWVAYQQRPEKQQPEMGLLVEAVALYQGDFLAGLQLGGSVEFDEWQRLMQTQLQQQLMSSLSVLAEDCLDEQQFAKAQGYAQRQLVLEPWHEKAQQQLMSALALAGERGAALAQYEKCCQILQDELGAEPSRETTILYERILADEVAATKPSPPPHNLTASVTTYFGREAEQKTIIEQVEAGTHRLMTLVGEGGVGKSRLAQEVGWQLKEWFADGVWFVPLASLAAQASDNLPSPSPSQREGDLIPPPMGEARRGFFNREAATKNNIATAIAAAMGQRLNGKTSPEAQLLELVRTRHACLLLDNFEHLLDGADLVMTLLGSAPQLQIICTSREPLGFMAESVFRLAQLALPTQAVADPRDWLTAVVASPTAYPAIQLFVDRAQRVNGRFALTPQNEQEVIKLCQLTAGIPLAIELAAAGMRQRTLAEQIETLQQGVDAFATRLRDVPARQRSVRAVFEGSWQLLTAEEQQLFASLSIFRGGFTRAAATAVAEASREQLERLQDKSLLQRDGERYWLHELLRQFAGEKSVETTRVRQSDRLTHSLASKHSIYYLNFVAEQEQALVGATPQIAARAIAEEIDNIRLGWETAVDEAGAKRLLNCVNALANFYQIRGLYREAEGVFKTAVSKLKSISHSEATLTCIAHLLAHQASMLVRLSRFEAANGVIEEALALVVEENGRWLQSRLHITWGESLYRQGHFDQAKTCLHKALEVAQSIAASRLIGWATYHLGIIDDLIGQPKMAVSHLEQAQNIWTGLGDLQRKGFTLNSIGVVTYRLKQFERSETALSDALDISQAIENPQMACSVLINLSLLATERQEFKQAQRELFRALEIAKFSGAKHTQALIHYNWGWNAKLAHQWDEANHFLKKSLALREKIGDMRGQCWALKLLGEVAQANGQLETARSFYQKALALNAKVGDVKILAEVSQHLQTLAETNRQQLLSTQLLPVN